MKLYEFVESHEEDYLTMYLTIECVPQYCEELTFSLYQHYKLDTIKSWRYDYKLCGLVIELEF